MKDFFSAATACGSNVPSVLRSVDLLVIGARRDRRAEVDHLGRNLDRLFLVRLHEGDGFEPALEEGAHRLRVLRINSLRAKRTWVMK